jgi:ATP-dependent helicase/nuclease subunit A
MNDRPTDQAARERFTREWGVNFAVSANAGSGKTTAISERLAAMALSGKGAELLGKMAVVTYTRKAAAQIGQRARSVLLRRMAAAGGADIGPLARLDRVFFGTIHSFCLLLARRHGSPLGIHLNPAIVEEGDDASWHEFLEQDSMAFSSLGPGTLDAFLRHASLDVIFDLAQELDATTARRLLAEPPAPRPPPPSAAALEEILALVVRRGADAAVLAENKALAQAWLRDFAEGTGRLPIPKAHGTAGGIKEHFRRYFAPVKGWLAEAGAVLASELALRYREWRLDRGLQTYADQIETVTSLLQDASVLERIRAEGWRVVLDEAQDADPKQFEVMVEIARAPSAAPGTWPRLGGPGPRPGHFCMVGDAQQGIYASRADIQNFVAHVEAFARGEGGEQLTFDVTFRAPTRVVDLLNGTLAEAFGTGRSFNFGLAPAEGAPEPFLQVPYAPLVPGPSNREGGAWRLPVAAKAVTGRRHKADRRLADEARQVAEVLKAGGPASIGAADWNSVCVIAARKAWLPIIRDAFEAAGLKTALQLRRNRSGDHPVYAWLCGLLAVVCDPENTFEWVGVLREIFAVSDAAIAGAVAGGRKLLWDEPESYPGALGQALTVLRPFITRADDEGGNLGQFAHDLAEACGLRQMARLVDAEGGLEDELGRLLAQAEERGGKGAGPRAWLQELLVSIDRLRASGRPEPDAVNLITAHSAKGLEWPVVIPFALWRAPGFRESSGLRILAQGSDRPRIVFDSASVDPGLKESRERWRLRELVRLLYVVLTRPRAALIIPWSDGTLSEPHSLVRLWGFDPGGLAPLPSAVPGLEPGPEATGRPAPEEAVNAPPPATGRASDLPRRVLPHQLTVASDTVRAVLHEAGSDGPNPIKDGPDPLDYGIWWHETVEHLPWSSGPEAIGVHGAAALTRAEELGFSPRAQEEWDRFLGSEPYALLKDPRWTRLAEVGLLAPLSPQVWIDGVVDLVLHDPVGKEVWVVDWKTNRRDRSEEDAALLERLAATYAGQLTAYGSCATPFFPGCRITLWVYSTVAGQWAPIAAP